jgi:TetR/AcrR family transcriptional regulator, cholesterol catabolism regulator
MSEQATTRRRGRPRDEARRQEVVDTAARLFAEHGYHATSLDELSAATGLQRGGLYHYIGSKENLLFMIHERFIEPLLEAAHAIEDQGDPPDVTLQKLAGALMSDIATYRDQVTVFLHEWRTIRPKDSDRARAVMDARREFEAVIGRTLRRGVAQGFFDITESRLATLGFLGMINYSYQWYRPGAEWSADDVAEAFCSFFLDGVRVR